MNTVRRPAVAGMFYPGDKAELTRTVTHLLGDATALTPPEHPAPKALIVPHAGYVYSGSTAALGYAQLAPVRRRIHQVVLLGPVHRVAVRGLALSTARVFATPVGDVHLDADAAARICDLPQVVTSDAAHELEHSLEVHLPFLLASLDEFKVLPLAVGDALPDEVADVLEAVWGGPETLIVVSSDLSHYLPYHAAQATDHQTVEQILALDGPLSHKQACGATGVNGLLVAARRHRLRPKLLRVCNSGDTAGDKRAVVGYAAFAFAESNHAR